MGREVESSPHCWATLQVTAPETGNQAPQAEQVLVGILCDKVDGAHALWALLSALSEVVSKC